MPRTYKVNGEAVERLTLSIPETAQILGISRSQMYALAKSDGFPTIAIGTRLLVSRKGLERWVEERSQLGWAKQAPELPRL